MTENDIRTIYRETIDVLYAWVSRRCNGDRALAEDVTQDVWLRAVRSWRRDGIPDRPLAWLRTVARNLLLNHCRRSAPVSLETCTTAEVLSCLEPATSDSAADEEEAAHLVRDALARLPARQSRLLRAFHFDRRRVAEIAATIGVSERAIEGRLRRARENLRREIEATLGTEGGRG